MQSYTKKTLATFIILVHIAFFTPFSNVTEAAILEPGFEVELIASGFTLPTAMTFAPDGRIFVAEKGGAVQVVKNGALLPTPAITLTDINTFGDRGLIGMAVDPNFAANGYLYLSYTYENSPGSNFSGPKTGRVVRVTVIGDTASESSKIVLVGTIGGSPALPSCEDYPSGSDCIPSDSMSHSAGGLRFGPDDKLYATFGDGSAFDTVDSRALRAQNLNSLGGKMIRINADGTAPLDNPFYSGDPNANISKVYVLGLRNAFRFNFEPGTGSLFLGDVGWSDWEEVNLVTPGANFGWPCHEGMNTTTYNCTASSSVTNPLYVYGHDSNGAGSITAGSFPSNGAYPAQYNNSFFFGDYAQNWIKRLVVSASSTTTSVENFMDDTAGQVPNGPVDISTGPDGNIYFLSIYTGDLNRLTHTTGNRRPVPAISANPTSGLTPLTVNFGSVGSIDPDNDPLTYSWNFGDSGTETSANPTHTYTINGTYTASLTLTDDKGSSASKSITINAGNQEPSPQITNPASGMLYMANQTIQLNGTATDPEDGTLSAPAFHWQIILHHNIHTHMIQEFDGVINPSFLGPDHGATDVYTEVVLTVTDSGGLTNARSINLYLNNGGSSGNLISNPSVEVEDPLPGRPFKWFQGWFGNLNPIFTYPVSGFEGTKAVQLEITSYTNGGAKWYFDPVFITPGEEYVFSNYYTANAPSMYTAQFGFSDGTFQYQSLGDVPPTAIPTKVEKNIIAPIGAQTVTVFHELDRVGILTTDTYSLTLASTLSDTTSPVVSISTPSTGSIASSTITVSVNATDDVGVVGVTLFVDDVAVLTEDMTSPYDFVWDTTTVTNGSHTLSAHARDAASNVAVSTGITVTVDNTVPTNLIQNGLLEIQNGANPLAWTSNSWGNNTAIHTYPVTGFNGQKAVRTEITNYPADGTGDAKWYFDQVAVTPGTTYTYTDHYRSNTISDIIGRYTLTGGGFHYFGLAKEIQPSLAWQTVSGTFTPPSDGTHVTFLHLISAVGFVEIDDAEMYVSGTSTPSETNVPIVEFTNPLLGQTVSGTITLTASSTDDTAVTYIFYAVDGIPITGQITQPPYSFNWDTTTVSNGSHTLKATTHDPSGNNSTHTITITVDNTVPPTSNLITNPSLETIGGNGDPQNWFRGGWGTNNRVFTYPVAGT
ncbi:MAG: PQQ-dependent sugar dehydrogenase, partial [bacterium]|nr:PQQ-dependent sugar dehydrogenase [bacterium]